MVINNFLILVLSLCKITFHLGFGLLWSRLLVQIRWSIVLRILLVTIRPWVFSITPLFLKPLLFPFGAPVVCISTISGLPVVCLLLVSLKKILDFAVPLALHFKKSFFYFYLHFLLDRINVGLQFKYSLLHAVGPSKIFIRSLITLIFQDRIHFFLDFLYSSHHILFPALLLFEFAHLIFLYPTGLPLKYIDSFLRVLAAVILRLSPLRAF